mgnify:CR=1 FL=1
MQVYRNYLGGSIQGKDIMSLFVNDIHYIRTIVDTTIEVRYGRNRPVLKQRLARDSLINVGFRPAPATADGIQTLSKNV